MENQFDQTMTEDIARREGEAPLFPPHEGEK